MPQQMQKNIVLAGLSSAGQFTVFSPVQIQKLFFIIDREVGDEINGHQFNFKPYDYGPFDKEVYETLEVLFIEKMVQINKQGKYNHYSLSPSGYEKGIRNLESLPTEVQSFISETAKWIKSITFEELVASIYKKYPDMKVNSVFRS